MSHKKHPWDEMLRTIIVAVLLAVTFRSCAFEPFHIPSGSMKSNLLIGDYLFVSKYAYGYSRYSFPFGLPLFGGRIFEGTPKRGDVAVFRLPRNPRIDYIKRIMGLPGDRLQVRSGILYINGKPLPRSPFGDYADTEGRHASCLVEDVTDEDIAPLLSAIEHTGPVEGAREVKHIPVMAETLPEGRVIHILKECARSSGDNTPIYQVPPGHYFAMGDNRDNSTDSRFSQVGYIPAENLVGRAEFIFFSTDGTADWTNPLSWFKAMRFERFFTWIE